jgi:predicted DNA-binding protein
MGRHRQFDWAVTVRADLETRDRVAALAKDDMTLADVVRAALDLGLEQMERRKAGKEQSHGE